MTKKVIFVLLVVMAVIFGVSCSSSKKAPEYKNVVAKDLGNHIMELPVYTQLNYEEGLKSDRDHFGKFGCTAVAKTLSNGDTIVGRSMDLQYSHSPVFLIRTAVPGFLKTVGLAYDPFHGTSYVDVQKNGLPYKEAEYLPFFTIDVMNEKGFYIEANMRSSEPDGSDIKPSVSTNPGAKYRMSFAALPRFLAERASNVTEAVQIAQTVDVHNLKTETLSWGGACLLADSTGHYGLLELVDNKLVWTDMQPAQANFYIHKDYKDRTVFGAGYGRYDIVTKGVGDVKSENDMLNLMWKVRMSQMLNPETCEFDPRGEAAGSYSFTWGRLDLTSKGAYDEENREVVMDYFKELSSQHRYKTIEQLRDEKLIWYSTWQLVANCNNTTLKVKFHERPELVYNFTV